MSIDSDSEPPNVLINTADIAEVGIYSVSITSLLNTTPKDVSTDAYEFVVSIQNNEPCSTI